MAESEFEFWGEPIASYTRAQAIKDGVLVDVTSVAREAGFRIPVALTAAAWAACVAMPPGAEDQAEGPGEAGRCWTALMELWFAIQSGPDGVTELVFGVPVRSCGGAVGADEAVVRLRAVCGPGDAGEPVLTIMLPGED